jgi:hypothetical protein
MSRLDPIKDRYELLLNSLIAKFFAHKFSERDLRTRASRITRRWIREMDRVS